MSSNRTAGAAKPKSAGAAKQSRPRATRPVAQAAPGDVAAAVARDEALRSNIAALRDVLAGGVVLTAQRVQDAMDDAVSRGRLTRDDAEQIVQGLVSTGRRQAQDVLGELETLFDRGADKVRRTAKLSAFPISGYDDLTAAAIAERLGGLGAADLRRVRDYEVRNANRKSVLSVLDKALG